MIKKSEPTIHDVLVAINTFATANQQDLNKINDRLSWIESKIPSLVTKDYLDKRLADLRGDVISVMRTEDHKFVELVVELRNDGKLRPHAAKRILAMQPFPRMLPNTA